VSLDEHMYGQPVTATAPRAEPSRRVRERLAHAAAELFQTQGYDDTTIEQIASQAGVGRRTFFRHYRSKEDVIFPNHDELLLKVRERLSLLPDESGVAAVTAAVKIVLRHYVDTREISLLRYKLVSEVPALREREIVSVARYQRMFRERLSEGVEADLEATLRAEVAAASVVAAHNLVLRHWLRSNGISDPFPELEQALGYVADTFNQTLPRDRIPADNEVIVLAFASSTSTSRLVAELTKARSLDGVSGGAKPAARRVSRKQSPR
jgi:AcrR family transcriptional regulator